MEIESLGIGTGTQTAQMQKNSFNSQVMDGALSSLGGNSGGAGDSESTFQLSVRQAEAVGKGTNINVLA